MTKQIKTKAKVKSKEPNAIEREIRNIIVSAPYKECEGSITSKVGGGFSSSDLNAQAIFVWMQSSIHVDTFDRLRKLMRDYRE